MNFLQICQRINQLSGLHGEFTDVTTHNDLQRNIAQGVNAEWLALQNLRKDWTFMVERHSLFTCTAGQELYTPQEVFGTTALADRLGTYIKDSFFLDYRPLQYICPSKYPYIDNTTQEEPKWFTIDTKNNNLYLDLPNDSYTFDIYYRKKAQDLLLDTVDPEGVATDPSTNWPNLPDQYHDALVYAGLAAFAVYTGNPEQYQKWSLELEKIKGAMMREFIPRRSMQRRSII